MMRASRIAAWLAVAAAGGGAAAAGEYAFHREGVMGTSLELRVRADTEEAARAAEARALGEIARLARVFSNHDPSSEFRRWQEASRGPARVSPELFEVLSESDRWRSRSGGAFDPRVQALSRLWSRAAERGREPTESERVAACAALRSPAWRLDPTAGAAERTSDAPLTLDAIAKGYIVERACDAALAGGTGVRGLLLNVGGDLRACGPEPWAIGVVPPSADSESAAPMAAVAVRDRAVATSGRSQRGYRIGGKWHSHIIDPRTGLPADAVAGATVIAERSADADALATILNVVAPEEGLRLVATVPGAECLIVAADGRVFRSAGWGGFEVARPFGAAEADGPKGGGGSWGDEWEVAIDFQINTPDTEGRPYRRPYVVVWVEDPKGVQVRTLLLWISLGGQGPFRWLPDLKRWYRGDQARMNVDKVDFVDTMSRPTRPPGKYSVVWDGKDNKGKPVPRGEYTIAIEAAREHGTYQVIRDVVTIGETPFRDALKGNIEIRSAAVEFRRKAAKP